MIRKEPEEDLDRPQEVRLADVFGPWMTLIAPSSSSVTGATEVLY